MKHSAPITAALCGLLALLAALAATPAHAQDTAGASDEAAWKSQWDALGDPEFGGETMKRRGWLFGGGLGAIYVGNDKELDGSPLGSFGFSGNAQIGGFVVEDDVGLSFLFHGMTGPRRGDAAFSVLNFLGRADFYVWDINNANHLYLIAGGGLSEIGTLPAQVVGGVKKGARYETSLIYGVGMTLKRFGYVQTSAEFMGLQVLSGPDNAHVVGVYLTAWFTTDAGLFE